MSEVEQVECYLRDIQKIATARLRACRDAGAKVNLVLVDKDRLEALEKLLAAAKEAFSKAMMTRCYTDVIERGETNYSGKK